MLRYIKASNEYSDIKDKINSLVESRSTSKIADILDDIPTGTRLRVATDTSMSRTTYFDRNDDGWEDNPYTYSSWDIADELVRGRFHFVYDIDPPKRLRPQKKVPERDTPAMWRKK